ncbi:hypothetical protein Alsa3_CDS0242 [Staphylococcus phage Alsa_3]|nr:hypothetical protein Alsa3_CDS0242 [Staphylococcus phage Alsa_3]WNM51369.1 hypothetical protein Alsa4_CDS0239 [Staphylococcus phage Alsa_4]
MGLLLDNLLVSVKYVTIRFVTPNLLYVTIYVQTISQPYRMGLRFPFFESLDPTINSRYTLLI